MNLEIAQTHVAKSLRDGADLRLKVIQDCGGIIAEAALQMAKCLQANGKLLFFGNGGSAADAQHLAAEFVGRFVLERRPLPAIALTTDSSLLTAIGNDYGFDQVFIRQIQALGCPNDIAVGISSSGNSPNVLLALKEARQRGLKTIGLSGKDGGAMAQSVDFPIVVRGSNTARIQECHIAIGHIFCELVEAELFP
jgi:D-sedoheptulose 7-phosphate isomerase